MRILLLHNRYLKAGGEDVALESEYRLLKSRGHEVRVIFATNNWSGTPRGRTIPTIPSDSSAANSGRT